MLKKVQAIIASVCTILILQTADAQVIFQQSADGFPLGTYTRDQLKEDFNTTWGNGFKKKDKGEDRVSVVNSPNPESGKSLKVKYPEGQHDSKESGAQWQTNLYGGWDELYLSYDVRFGSNFNLDKNGKLPGLAGGLDFDDEEDDNTSWDGKLMFRSGGKLEFYLHQPITNEKHFGWYKDGTQATVQRNRWYNIEIRYKLNTAGQNNGLMQAWLDGVLVGEYKNFGLFRTNNNVKINKFFFSTFFGGNAVDNPSQDNYAWFDNFVVSTQRINNTGNSDVGDEPEDDGNDDPVSVSNVNISSSNFSLEVDQTKDLNATVSPADAEDKSVTWSSNNVVVATVNQSGLVTAKSAGTAVIKVRTSDGGHEDQVTVTVNAPASDDGSADDDSDGGSTGGADASVRLEYQCGDTDPSNNNLKPYFRIKNTGAAAVPMSELKVRYWFKKEGTGSPVFNVNYAAIGKSNVLGSFGNANGHDYAEVSFKNGAGSINPNKNSGNIKLRITYSNWSTHVETNDYSFDPSKTSYTAYSKMTIYQNGNLVWGTEPGSGARVGDGSVSSVSIAPNPASGNIMHIIGLSSDADVRIMSMDGKIVFSGAVTQSGDIDISALQSGVYSVSIEDAAGVREIRLAVK